MKYIEKHPMIMIVIGIIGISFLPFLPSIPRRRLW